MSDYSPLTPETLPGRLGLLAPLTARLGPPSGWSVREIGDGNLNLVFVVEGAGGAVIAKQALPYIRLVGEGWPLPLNRAFFEVNALTRQDARDPGSVPEVFHFDEAQALIVMEYLTPHMILRRRLIEGRRTEALAARLGAFCARTAFRGSDLSMPPAERKADLALFAGNAALCDITERLVFTDPYFDAPLNRHTPGLEALVAELRADADLKIAAQMLKTAFVTRAETLLHGDLHTGSVMATDSDLRVIDPEFASYGPMGFDIGMLIANFLMAVISQPGHGADRADFTRWLTGEAAALWPAFEAEFRHLWRSERRGILHPACLYEEQHQPEAARRALSGVLRGIWEDAVGFCGVELHRRILGLAHNADFEAIADPAIRAGLEAQALRLGRILAGQRGGIRDMAEVLALLQDLRGDAP